MKRKAILIESSNVEGQTDLPGARLDVQNWRNFLKSDLGGLWLDSEIVTLRKPYSSQVTSELKVDSDCYCFVAFSGHGRDGSVVLNKDYTQFPISSMRPTGDRGTTIIDSCRGVEAGRQYQFSNSIQMILASEGVLVVSNSLAGKETAFASADTYLNRAQRQFARFSEWEDGFKKSQKGIVEMLSCAKGQAAQEDANAGGYYTSLLLQSAESWSNGKTTAKIHTTKHAHDYAAGLLPPQQTPEYKPTWLEFPFAVKA